MTTHIHETTITIAQRIVSLRRARGWSQTKAAVAAGMSVNHVHYLEHGHSEPSMETMRKLAHAFGLTLSEFLEGVS